MDGETRVLQDRIEIAALERRVGDAQKRVGRRENEKLKGRRDPRLHGERIGFERRGEIVAECRDQRAEKGEDQHPQHHGAFVIAPDAGEPVDERHRRIRILEDVEHREVGGDVAYRQRAERQRHEKELRQRGRDGDACERRVIRARPDDRRDRLDQRQAEREHERIMSKFGNHDEIRFPCFPCALVIASSPAPERPRPCGHILPSSDRSSSRRRPPPSACNFRHALRAPCRP